LRQLQQKLSMLIPRGEVERPVERSGPVVRQMGVWRHATDGSLEAPVSNIAAAARLVGGDVLTQALQELKSPRNSPGYWTVRAARRCASSGRGPAVWEQFERKVQRYQDIGNAEAHKKSRWSCSGPDCRGLAGCPFPREFAITSAEGCQREDSGRAA